MASSWNALAEFIQSFFHEPDLEALRIVLATCLTHSFAGSEPVWLFVQGPSRSGKTAICVEAASVFPNAQVKGDITPKAWISGKRGGASLLHDLGPSFILIFRDFSSIIEMREEERRETIKALRQVYDGAWSRTVGEIHTAPWQGKATVIAAVTPNIERAWSVVREMGDRFLTVKWRPGSQLGMAAAAERQAGHRAEIKATLQSLTRRLVTEVQGKPPMALPEPMSAWLHRLAVLVAWCRRTAIRSDRQVVWADEPEAPTTIAQGLSQLAKAHAILMGDVPGDAEVSIIRRVSLDSIPTVRRRIINALPTDGSCEPGDVAPVAHLSTCSILYHLDELIAVGICLDDSGYAVRRIEMTAEFARLWRSATHNPI